MKYRIIILLILCGHVFAQSDQSGNSELRQKALSFVDCNVDNHEGKFKGADDFVKTLKAGEMIDPADLVNNPVFINPCFKEKSSQYQTSFFSLTELARSVSEYNNVEYNIIKKANDSFDELGKTRTPVNNKVKASGGTTNIKEAPKGPVYSKSFSNFKKKAKLVGTVETGATFLAHLVYGDMPINDIKVGMSVKGVEVVEIGFGYIKFRDMSHSKALSTLWVGA